MTQTTSPNNLAADLNRLTLTPHQAVAHLSRTTTTADRARLTLHNLTTAVVQAGTAHRKLQMLNRPASPRRRRETNNVRNRPIGPHSQASIGAGSKQLRVLAYLNRLKRARKGATVAMAEANRARLRAWEALQGEEDEEE
ncbi:hypothetical protein LTR35_004190 [Friedmanniomyces endolithicus]|uniref:Uncharacterized protein n=1 Tax=Friedmanniomyces endolithicus TaxID=329885 RepID=A0AAN6FYF4_9PEZI|nr:hypothetical protein LTR35_004190 [Friedmanniomyces endolithicus]KAK0294427.1 hypothetical protein LTS00_007017 [Friedmanniomyces endolithicus]KAK0326719.1 hypothetical protein LTR82_002562 [Friedmanniomyces endolithicus]KAK1017672.1 hypothetical protein LTR54_002331 [Friedmanniomyces endolithicus]